MTGPEPSSDQAKFERAHALWQAGQSLEAVRLIEPLIRKHPGNAGLFSALGVCRYECGDLARARQALERALALDPGQDVAAYNLAHVLLTLGEEERGLELYERRWSGFAKPAWHPSSELAWDGGFLDGTLLVLAEQGFGDMIQFARFLPLAAGRCRRLLLAVPPELKRLLAEVQGVAQVVTSGEPLPSFDRFTMLPSLAVRLRAFGNQRPQPPYLSVPEGQINSFPAPEGLMKIGLVWQGRVDNRHQKARALTLKALGEAVSGVRGCAFYSLQLGEGRGQLADWPGPVPPTDLSDEMTDFAATAVLLDKLDLLVTVDTAIAHLAGALNRPAFVLLPKLAHWVWGVEGETTPWYPSLRLLRADGPDWQDWHSALLNLRAGLSERVDSVLKAG